MKNFKSTSPRFTQGEDRGFFKKKETIKPQFSPVSGYQAMTSVTKPKLSKRRKYLSFNNERWSSNKSKLSNFK